MLMFGVLEALAFRGIRFVPRFLASQLFYSYRSERDRRGRREAAALEPGSAALVVDAPLGGLRRSM